jgi:hypothetical protein
MDVKVGSPHNKEKQNTGGRNKISAESEALHWVEYTPK